jgi:hypothetical protein
VIDPVIADWRVVMPAADLAAMSPEALASADRYWHRFTPEERADRLADYRAWQEGLAASYAARGFTGPDAEPRAREVETPVAFLERHGPSYAVRVPSVGGLLVFREVRTDRELTADLAVYANDRRLFRSTVTLSLTGRDRIAKTAAEMASRPGQAAAWRVAVFRAVEAVLEAEETVADVVDLRTAELAADGERFAAEPLIPNAPTGLIAPGESGKSTLARALAVSITAGREIVPGVVPRVTGPVLYVAAEDSVVLWHARSIEAICRGAGLDRARLKHPIQLLDARGRKLHRIGRAIAERASDTALVVIDSLTALLPSLDAAGGGVRERDSAFYDAIDLIARPTLIVAHPNLASAKAWDKSDGRIAGSEVNRDRLRMAWRLDWRDEPAVVGTSFRRYTVACGKWNHGPRPAPLSFAAAWTFGTGEDPGVLTFTASDTLLRGDTAPLSPQLVEALGAYRAGATTPAPLAARLGIPVDTAKSRLRLLRARGAIGQDEEVTDVS